MIEAAKCDMALSNSEESQKLLLKITKKFSRTQNFIVCYNYTENIKSRKPSKYQDNWQILHQNFLALQGPLVKKSYHLSSHIGFFYVPSQKYISQRHRIGLKF